MAKCSKSVASVSVFVRVRPLIESEAPDLVPGLALDSNDTWQTPVVVLENESMTIGGFAGVLGQEAANIDVFDSCFSDQILTVLRGGTASLFCYGYTGSGKTHTVIGYGEERGMYYLAAERLLQKLGRIQPAGAVGVDGAVDEELFLRATACEIYNDNIYDLLGTEKLECTLRTDSAGQLVVMGPPQTSKLEGAETGIPEELLADDKSVREMHATILTQSEGLRSLSVHSLDDLLEISRSCVTKRATGSSTEHAQSSRSHAILRMEVVNSSLLRARAALDDAKALVPARRNAVDNGAKANLTLLHDGMKRVLRQEASLCADLLENVYEEDDLVVLDASAYGAVVQGFECEGMKTMEEWSQHFGLPGLKVAYVAVRRDFGEPGAFERKRNALRAQSELCRKLLAEADAVVRLAEAKVEAVMSSGPSQLGGSLLVVDLAGADYDHRVGSQQKESAAINKSLLALKECFRSLAGVSPQKPKFRDSKLTRILEDSLAPSEMSSRRQRESTCVMLVNVSPAAALEKMTMNSLRYGQMYAVATPGRTSRAKGTAAVVRKPSGPVGGVAFPEEPVDPDVRAELLRIYNDRCPEKSFADVEAILNKFAGRPSGLQALLHKVREKYGCTASHCSE